MKKFKSALSFTSRNTPFRLLRNDRQPDSLPVPLAIRRAKRLEKWRGRLWQANHKDLFLIGPQHRELMRKMEFSMRTAGLGKMIPRLRMGVFLVWSYTGCVTELQGFIERVFHGIIFLINSKEFLPDTLPAGVSKTELLYRLLLYNPHVHKNGIALDEALNAQPFFNCVGPMPKERPWITQWESDIETVRKEMVGELGEATANELCSAYSCISGGDHTSIGVSPQIARKIAYW